MACAGDKIHQLQQGLEKLIIFKLFINCTRKHPKVFWVWEVLEQKGGGGINPNLCVPSGIVAMLLLLLPSVAGGEVL